MGHPKFGNIILGYLVMGYLIVGKPLSAILMGYQ